MPRRNSRDPETDPAAAFGQALAGLREAAGIATQDAAAARLKYSHDTISRWETGAAVPDEAQLARLLDEYGATGILRDTVTAMRRLARKAKGPIPQFAEKYFAAEALAAFIRIWAVLMVPGLLQTREYAHAMYRMAGLPEEEATEKTDVRVNRQAVLDGPEPPHLTAVIHELALHFLVGDAEIMVAQLTRLLELSQRRTITIQVVPNRGHFVGVEGAFEIASGDGMPNILMMVAVEDQPSEEPALTRKVLAVFEEVRGYALSVEESRAVMREAIEKWKSRQQ
jgi:transcriptional regulator with XRE-family HTH domain